MGQKRGDTQTGGNAGDGAKETGHAATLSGSRRTRGCAGSRCCGVTGGVGGGRGRSRRALCGYVTGLSTEALATAGATGFSIERHGQHTESRNRQNRHGEESRKTLRHYECLLCAPGYAARVKKIRESGSILQEAETAHNACSDYKLMPSCSATMPALRLKYLTRD